LSFYIIFEYSGLLSQIPILIVDTASIPSHC
jgi:hypothetical protein